MPTLSRKLFTGRMVRAIEAGLEGVDIEFHRRQLAEDDRIVAAAFIVVAPNCAVGEHIEERCDLALHDGATALVPERALSTSRCI